MTVVQEQIYGQNRAAGIDLNQLIAIISIFNVLNTCKLDGKALPLHRVFHSIRFKVNKVGVRRYSIFFVQMLARIKYFN